MFARKVSVCLKPNTLRPFVHLVEAELLPWLKTQNGFVDLITLACPDAIEVQVISFWESARSAETPSEAYPQKVVKMLEVLLDGISYGKTFEVVSSTLDRFISARPGEVEDRGGAERSDQGYMSYETSA
jgi:hypothetical protein